MALNITYEKVYGIPLAPDAISVSNTGITSFPVIIGDYVSNVNLNVKTYTFDFRGVDSNFVNARITDCDANAEALAKGELDFLNPSGSGVFSFNGDTCVPIAYTHSGTISVGGSDKNYSSFQLTCITNVPQASI